MPEINNRPAGGAETLAEARRTMETCNACRYCEGFCPVFPAMELRRAFSDADLGYLALGWVTMGQILSAPMIIAGVILIVMANRTKQVEPIGA